jgi:hypothetical protein
LTTAEARIKSISLITDHNQHSIILAIRTFKKVGFDAAGDSGKVNELGFGMGRDNTGQGGFAHPRRLPEDHGGTPVAFDEAAQYLARAQQVALAHELPMISITLTIWRFSGECKGRGKRGKAHAPATTPAA